jgi:hypothetical protein
MNRSGKSDETHRAGTKRRRKQSSSSSSSSSSTSTSSSSFGDAKRQLKKLKRRLATIERAPRFSGPGPNDEALHGKKNVRRNQTIVDQLTIICS